MVVGKKRGGYTDIEVLFEENVGNLKVECGLEWVCDRPVEDLKTCNLEHIAGVGAQVGYQ